MQVNYHTLSDFRKDHGEALDEMLSANVATLIAAGRVVKLRQVAHDGMRVRASAGAGSFRREDKLASDLEAARERVAQLKAELEANPGKAERARQAARLRAARVAETLARLPELEAIKRRQGKAADQARASTTDAEAAVMKVRDGGFRPAHNPQLASDVDSLVIVGVEVSRPEVIRVRWCRC